MAYTTLTAVKLDLGRSDVVDDTVLGNYITEVGDFISGYVGYSLDTDSATTYTYDGYSAVADGRCLPIPGGVRSITTLKVAPQTGGTLVAVAAADFFLRPLAQDRAPGWPATEVWLNSLGATPIFYPGFSNIEITTGTFGSAAVPARVEGVARRTVVRAWAARQAGGNDLLGTGGDGGTPLISQFLSRRDREVLDSFKGINVR